MTLQDFESKIDEVILERGRRYYSDNKVFNLLNPSPDLWTAYIHGSDKYAVQIYIINNEIITYRCTCPYNMGPTCKHVVATLFTIKNPVKSTEPPKSMAKKKTSAPKTGAVTQKVGLILEKASKEELSNFITSEFRYNSELKTSFLAHFEDYTKTESDDNYRQIVRSIRKSAQDRHGFIDYYNARKIVRPLQDLLIGAERLIETNNLKESLVIACTFIEEIPLMVAHMDDSDGSAGDLYYFAIQLVEQISELATPDIKEFIFKFLIKEYPKKKYHDFSFESPFLLQLSKAITTKKQELRFLKLIDSQITLLANAGHMDYKLSELVSTKTDYLLSASKEKEAWQLVNKYLHLSSLRAKQIEKEKLE